MTVRQDYYYPSLEKSLIEIVEVCVSSVILGGHKLYCNRVDFIKKAIQNQIETEAKKDPLLEHKISEIISNRSRQQH